MPTDIGTKWSSPSEMQPQPKTQPLRLPKPLRITEQVWPDGTLPVVSVFSWAYNHAEFIRESIESILMQETTFPVEIIIHDDASTDGTTEIIREYEAKYPQLFCNIIQTENQWSQGKSVMTPMFTAPRGEFIALTHGDDYWTSPLKLQRQCELLMERKSASLCYHRYGLRPLDSVAVTEVLPTSRMECVWDIFTREKGHHTATMFFRRDLVRLFPPWVKRAGYGDVAMQLALSDLGSLASIDEVWSVHRKHVGGTSYRDSRDTMARTLIEIALEFDVGSQGRHRSGLAERIVELHLWGAQGALREGNTPSFLWHQAGARRISGEKADLRIRCKEFDRLLLDYYLQCLFEPGDLAAKFRALGKIAGMGAKNVKLLASCTKRQLKQSLRAAASTRKQRN